MIGPDHPPALSSVGWMGAASLPSAYQGRTDSILDLLHGKRLAAHLAEGLGVDQEPGPQQHAELAEVHLGHDHMGEGLEQWANAFAERVDIANVAMRDGYTLGPQGQHGLFDGAVGAAPADDQYIALFWAGPEETGADGLHISDLLGPQFHHLLVVEGVIADLAGDVLFL